MRMMFEKNFTGTPAATSFVSMLGILNRDLGSGGYADLSDKMNIEIVNGEHFFTFEYSLTR